MLRFERRNEAAVLRADPDNTILFYQIVDDGLFTPNERTGQDDYQLMESLYDMGLWTNRLVIILFDNNVIQLARILEPYGVRGRTIYACLMRFLTTWGEISLNSVYSE